MGRDDEALALYREAIDVRSKTLSLNHPDLAGDLSGLGSIYLRNGIYDSAQSYFDWALRIRRKSLGETHPNIADNLGSLGLVHTAQRNYESAKPLLLEASRVLEQSVGQEHPSFVVNISNLAILYAATDQYGEALSLMRQASTTNDRLAWQVFSIGSESQRTAFLKTIEWDFDAYFSLVSQHLYHSSEAVRFALDLVLRRKAIAAEAIAAQRDAVLGGKYPHLEPKLRELSTLRMQIAQKTLAGPGREGLETHRKLLAEWNAQKETLEQELARQIPEMNLEERLRAADRQAVAKALPEGAALIEFVRFNVFDFKAVPARGETQWKPARYLAFVLLAGDSENVQMIDLREAERIDKLIAQYRESITDEVSIFS